MTISARGITSMPLSSAARPWLLHGALALAGAAIALSFAPFNWWWTAPLALAALVLGLQNCTPKQAFRRGWSFGSGLFLAGASWIYVSIHDYGFVPVLPAALLTTVFCVGIGSLQGLLSYGYVRWLRDGRAGATLGFAALWVLGEWLRSWLLTGFPWLYLGYAHLHTPLAGWAPVTGVLSIGFIVALTGAALAALVRDRRQWPPLAAVLALALLGQSLLQQHWTERSSDTPLRVAAVQINISQDQKWRPENLKPTLIRYREMTLPLFEDHQLVIWPEAAIPAFFHQVGDYLGPLASRAEENGSSLITGVPYWTPGHIYNSAVAMGNGDGSYFKQRLVPFGEYVPLENSLGKLIRIFELPLSSFSAGGPDQGPLRAGGLRLAPFICYEIVYPDLVARHGRDADVLLTLSNDAWFGRSLGPAQHMQMAQMRALETGRQLIRATGTGLTALVDERGRITASIPSHQPGVLSGEIYPFRGYTPFSRAGSLPILLLCALLCALALRRRA